MKAKEFFYKTEKVLIDKIGLKDVFDNKVYTPKEMIEFAEQYAQHCMGNNDFKNLTIPDVSNSLCTHSFVQTDQYWQRCRYCGLIKPLGQ